jgi:hypothetical protein
VIYPPGFLRILKDAGTGFLHSCLKADDIWLHANAVRSGYMVKQARDRAAYFLEVPGSRQTALFKTNVRGDHNDKQIRAVYGDAELVLLKQAVHSHIA